VQLGELQRRKAAFDRRRATLVAISVDAPAASGQLIERHGLTFALASDTDQEIMGRFGIINPKTKGLALHAVYIVAPDGKVLYRKVARRRPKAAELLDAIDGWAGTYPQPDVQVDDDTKVQVAFPRNRWQMFLAVADAAELPASITAEDRRGIAEVEALLDRFKLDDALVRWREVARDFSSHVDLDDGLTTSTWVIRNWKLPPTAVKDAETLRALLRKRDAVEGDAQPLLAEIEATRARLRDVKRASLYVSILRGMNEVVRSQAMVVAASQERPADE